MLGGVPESTRLREAFFLEAAERIANALTRCVPMLVGGLRSRAVMERVVAGGTLEPVGVAQLAFDDAIRLEAGEVRVRGCTVVAPWAGPVTPSAAAVAEKRPRASAKPYALEWLNAIKDMQDIHSSREFVETIRRPRRRRISL